MPSEIARKLRRNQTDAERKLWSILRSRQIAGRRFRRQAPIGPFIVDFVCFAERLVIEVDGGQHAINERNDIARTQWLESQGFRVLRFWNNEVMANLDGVGDSIKRALTQVPDGD